MVIRALLVVLPELTTSEVRPQVCYYCSWNAKPVDDFFNEVCGLLSSELVYWLVFYPLGELIDCHQYVVVSSGCLFEGPDHVQPPACEWP